MRRYDAVVVGARVAGASTALLLARAGARVALLDRSSYGSDTLSTHGLMRAGVLQLSRWGVLEDVTGAGTPPIGRTTFHYADGERVQVSIRPSPGVDALYAPRRHLFDRILVDHAAAAGVDVMHGVTAVGLLADPDGGVGGVQALGRDGRVFELPGRVTVGADGIRSTVADTVGAPVVRSARHAGAVLYRYYRDLPVTGFEWAYGHRAAAGLIPTNDGLTCVFVGTAPQTMRALRRDGAESAFSAGFAAAAPDLVARLAEAKPEGRLRGWGGVPGYVRRAWGPGWALVGDAGYFKDPITTHGMTDALRDAELLAREVPAALAGPAEEGRALAAYERRRDEAALPLAEITDAVASYRWSLPEVRELLLALSKAMSHEVAMLTGLDTPSEAAARSARSTPSKGETTAPNPSIASAEPVEALLAALRDGDFAALETLLAPDVWLRNLLVKQLHESTTAADAVEAFRSWVASPHGAVMLDSEHRPLANRELLRYRFLVRPVWAPDRWHVLEQTGYCRVKDGRISRLDLACTGYFPADEAGVPAETIAAAELEAVAAAERTAA